MERTARDYKGNVQPMPTPAKGKLVATYADGMVEAWHTRGKFAVVYGLSISENLDYAQAAKELGSALFHALQCDGKLDS